LLLALVALLIGAGNAAAAFSGPDIALPPFTKAQLGPGNFVLTPLNWTPAHFFDTTPQDTGNVVATALDGGVSTSASIARDGATTSLLLTNGRLYKVDVSACQGTACLTASSQTRVDATPPSGTVAINNGAAFTNNPAVTLNLTATDPLIDGIADSSSGVTQQAVDVNGDGTYPCDILVLIGQPSDTSGCAGAFAPTVQATLPTGDGPKTVGVKFGDGARDARAPSQCPPICVIFLGSPILGNASASATDTIGLDTVKPEAVAVPDRATLTRGGSQTFNSSTSTDSGTGASGIDPTATTWNFQDGTTVATGERVTHTFASAGTFIGELRVRDRAGNISNVRNFVVTVNPPPAATAAGGGSIAGVTGTAGFSVASFRVKAKYTRSLLAGSIAVAGSSGQAGPLRAEIRAPGGTRVIKRISLNPLTVGPYLRSVKLPATLLPGSYRIDLVGPGGTLRTTLKLTPPREGVIRSGRIVGARAVFSLAARPVKALRTKLTVRWTQGRRVLGVVTVGSGTTIRASLPSGASFGSGKLTATLRAGTKAVGSASKRIR